jgi:hypothetical protein
MRNSIKDMDRNATLIDQTTFGTKGMHEKLEH